MIRFRLGDGRELIRRFLVNKRAFKLALPWCVRLARVAGLRFARGLDAQQFRRDIAHGAFGLLLRLVPARAAKRVERRVRLASADVFADEMRLGDGNIKFRRLIAGIGGGVFDDKTFRAGFFGWASVLTSRSRGLCRHRLPPRTRRQIFQAEKFSDAVLEMDDEIAFLQIGEINVERGTGCERMRRFEPARALDFVSPENFRVGDHDQFCLVADETTGERAEMSQQLAVSRQ